MQDTISQRDTGWMQFYCMSNQEILDQILLAYKVAEQVMIRSWSVSTVSGCRIP